MAVIERQIALIAIRSAAMEIQIALVGTYLAVIDFAHGPNLCRYSLDAMNALTISAPI
jgi:hypothetical protein